MSNVLFVFRALDERFVERNVEQRSRLALGFQKELTRKAVLEKAWFLPSESFCRMFAEPENASDDPPNVSPPV